MNASKAKRRWMAWCRYMATTETRANPSRRWGTDAHDGQSKAYQDCMFAGRPRGARVVYYPKWGCGVGCWWER